MDWSKGYTSAFYAYIIDPVTWRETTRIQITGGTINRNSKSLRESATINCRNYDQSEERWIRVYMDTEQSGASSHVPLFTGLATSPEQKYDGNIETNDLDCFSVLKPAEDILLERGYYVPAEMGVDLVLGQLLSVCPAPLSIEEDAPYLQSAIIAEDDETCLSMADKVLDAIDWQMRVMGDGTIAIGPKPTEPIRTFSPLDNDVIELEITVKKDWFECPNVFRAIDDDLVAVARDDDPNSPLSTINRGREVWAQETNVSLNSGESIAEYAQRKLKTLQTVGQSGSYQRRFYPDVMVGDIIRLNYPRQELNGLYKIVTQKIEIGYGARTEEDVEIYEY